MDPHSSALKHKASMSFGVVDSKTFGTTIKMGPMEMLNSMVINLFGDGIMKFDGSIDAHKVKEDMAMKRRLWKYIQYLWIWNDSHEVLAELVDADGNATSQSFEAGVRRVMRLPDSADITVDILVDFINNFVVHSGVEHPVLEDLESKIMRPILEKLRNPAIGIEPKVVAYDTKGDMVELQSETDGNTLRVKLTP